MGKTFFYIAYNLDRANLFKTVPSLLQAQSSLIVDQVPQWLAAIALWVEQPLLGIGLVPFEAGDLYSTILVGLGVVGLLALLFLLLRLATYGFWRARLARRPHDHGLVISLGVVFVALVVIGAVTIAPSSPLYWALLGLCALLFAGLVRRAGRSDEVVIPTDRVPIEKADQRGKETLAGNP